MIACLNTIIAWLDQHSGSMIVMLTFFLVAITASYVRKTSAMVDEVKRQNDMNTEPDISISSTVDYGDNVTITDGKITLQVRNDGSVNVVDIKFIPLQLWTIQFQLKTVPLQHYLMPWQEKILETKILKPTGVWDIEFDVSNVLKRKQEADFEYPVDFAFQLFYRRETDLKRYIVKKRFELLSKDEPKFFLPMED